ncbi:MAG: DUF4433 domain-containing protein [Acidobacteria bacterium]|nr:DUF4433 domain-containing protein [Acidobacteriota bacterium]
MTFDEFMKVVQAKGSHHSYFYHFTDTRNLASIAKYGLLSLRQLSDRGIKVAAPGGNEWSHDADRHKGLDDHVHLCFMDEHVRRQHP